MWQNPHQNSVGESGDGAREIWGPLHNSSKLSVSLELFQSESLGDLPGGSVVKNPLSSTGMQVQSCQELRPHMPGGN